MPQGKEVELKKHNGKDLPFLEYLTIWDPMSSSRMVAPTSLSKGKSLD